ncbi:ATP-binding protein [Rhizobium sp. WW22]|uniref:ATP-binding protein n=1 Tax=Rhizobium sp. WW22 TaxID=3389070 RepID=UPI00399C02C5
MKYTKVFNSTRFQTRSPNGFSVEPRDKQLFVGIRSEDRRRTAMIGKVLEQGKSSNLLDHNVFCDVSFPHVVGIFGSRGSGKSFDLGVFLEGIFLNEELTRNADTRDAAIVFDVQDQFWTLRYEPKADIDADQGQMSELRRWGLVPAAVSGVRVFVPAGSDTQVPHAEQFSLAPGQLNLGDWLAILDLERFSAMGQALLTLLGIDGPKPPAELAVRCIPNGPLSSFQQATLDALRWRLESLANTSVIASQGVSVDELLIPGRLSVILMRNLPEAVRGLVVGVISRLVADRMGRIQQARKVAMRTSQVQVDRDGELTNRLWLVLDEAHVLVPSDGYTAATEPLIDYVKRGRDAGLSLVFATQQPSAVNSKLMSQVDLTITHMLGFDADLTAATARMPTRTTVDYDVDNQKAASLTDVIRSLGPGEAIIADGSSSRAFVAKIRPRVSAHGGATPK